MAERIGLRALLLFAEDELCPICQDTRRDPTLLCVVEEPSAILPIERTHEFRGYYHVLGGALSPIDGVDPDDLRIDELVRRIADEGVQELVVATNPTMTGEATSLYWPTCCAARCSSRAWRAACRSEPTSSTPTS